jgi:putative DNA primase/helicase
MEMNQLLDAYPPRDMGPRGFSEQELADWVAMTGMRNTVWVPGAHGGSYAIYEDGRFMRPSKANTAGAQELFMTTVSGMQAISDQIPPVPVLGSNGEAQEGPDPLAENLIGTFNKLQQRNKQSNVKALMKERLTRTAEQFDQTPGLLNFQNGVLDVETGERKPHDPKYLHMNQIQADWDPDAPVPDLWLKALERSFQQDSSQHTREVLDVLQQLLGLTMLGDMPEKFVIYVYDDGDSGKTTLQGILQGVLGEGYAITISYGALEKTARSSGGPNPEIDRMRNAHLVLVDEMTQDSRIDPAMMKLLTGRGRMWSRGMYASGGEWHPRYLLWLAGNSLASIDYDETALYRRLVIIKGHPIPVEEQDTELVAKLATPAARAGIAQWLWQGVVRWREGGKKLVLPEWLVREREAARDDVDPLQQFVTDSLVPKDGAELTKSDMYKAYTDWHRESGQSGRALNQKRFKELMRAREHALVKNIHGLETWRGLALKDREAEAPC